MSRVRCSDCLLLLLLLLTRALRLASSAMNKRMSSAPRLARQPSKLDTPGFDESIAGRATAYVDEGPEQHPLAACKTVTMRALGVLADQRCGGSIRSANVVARENDSRRTASWLGIVHCSVLCAVQSWS